MSLTYGAKNSEIRPTVVARLYVLVDLQSEKFRDMTYRSSTSFDRPNLLKVPRQSGRLKELNGLIGRTGNENSDYCNLGLLYAFS
jgi:hypothetical protein